MMSENEFFDEDIIDPTVPEEEMTVELELDDGVVTCVVKTIFEADGKDYIALLPLNEKGEENEEGDVWIYGYSENPDNPNEEPEIRYIEDDEEYEIAADKFEEWLDSLDFDEM